MFEIRDRFYLNGKPFQIISGSFHYFRTVPEYWRDRLEKLKNMGCNTVETYIPWNFHEPRRGKFLFDGMRDVCRFIETAQELGLYIILRPSPYICAEWELGGLPSWLLKEPGMRLRCSYKPYLDAVYDYYKVLIPKLAPYQISRGGSVILFQIENEYGYFGNDESYLQFLADTMREFGIDVPFITSDGPWSPACFNAGQLPEALPTGNFGSAMEWQLDRMRELIGADKPLMCTEFWVGWFDAWGEEHHVSDLEQNKADLEEILRRGNVNFYMFEGGTSFGFMGGRNEGAKTADVTSYDYDAPLTEDGRITPKYLAFKEIIGKYADIHEIPLSTEIKRKEYGKLACTKKTDLFSVLSKLSKPEKSVFPMSMEQFDQDYGYILYRTKLHENEAAADVVLEGAADRVQAFSNGNHIFTAFGENIGEKFEVQDAEKGAVLDFLAENCGRVNFGALLEEQRKGITRGVRVNSHRQFGWEIFTLPLDAEQLEKIEWDSGYREGVPAFYRFDFTAYECCDAFLDLENFGKGCAFINGFNLGRFWEIGPQKRLYVPAPLINRGENTIIVFETEGKAADNIFLAGEPRL